MPLPLGRYRIIVIRAHNKKFAVLREKLNVNNNSPELIREVERTRKLIASFHYKNGLSYEKRKFYEKALVECNLGLEGVSTDEAASTIKRIKSKIRKIKYSMYRFVSLAGIIVFMGLSYLLSENKKRINNAIMITIEL